MSRETADHGPADHETVDRGTPWSDIVRLALIGTLGTVVLVIFHMGGLAANPLSLVQPGADGPSVEVFRQDFPDTELPSGLGLDGQQYYAMARNPFDLDEVADQLDRPEYRLRRPVYAWLAWALHPTGGGTGLVLALVGVSVAGAFVGGVAAGALSTGLGGRAWPAVLVPLLPGSFMSVRVSVADGLAVAFVLAALACSARRRPAPALALAVVAALTKESMVVVLVGWALARRTRHDAALAVVPAAVVGAWALYLRVVLPEGAPANLRELVPPLTGVPDAVEYWLDGHGHWGMLATVSAVALAAYLLTRVYLRHPLSWVLVVNLAFLSVMHWNVLALDFGGTRSTMPLLAAGLVALGSRSATAPPSARQGPQRTLTSPEHIDAGIAGASATDAGASTKR